MYVNEDRTISSPLDPIPKATDDVWMQLYTKLRLVNPESEIFVEYQSGKTLTAGRLLTNIDNIAANLVQQGFNRTFPVVFVMVNGIEYAQVLLAVLKLGGVVSLINPLSAKADLSKYFELLECQIVMCDELTATNVVDAAPNTNVKKIFSTSIHPGTTPIASLLSHRFLQAKDVVRPKPDDLAMILFSSGTTGFPKGVELSHSTVSTYIRVLNHPGIKMAGDSSILIYQPFSHVYGIALLCCAILECKASIILKRFDMEEYITCVRKYKVDMLYFVPPLAVMFTKGGYLQKYDLSYVTDIYCGAAMLSDNVIEELNRQSNNRIRLRQIYGMTECLATCCPLTGNYPRQTVGLPLPGVKIKIVDTESGKSLAPMERGELCILSEAKMKGYHKNKAATDQTIDKDGWLHTGDIAYYNKDGYIFIVDRLKEIIKYNALQVPPAELEDTLLSHPDVADAGVTGLPDELAGELPFAYVVLKPGRKITEQKLHSYVNERVAKYKRLRGGIRFVSMIPKSPSGKILRRVIKQEQISRRNSKL